ncbi:acyl-CoA dehydratase activase-related protein [Natranaerobius trueperi]|uniref:DUF2229 domain-containing protein n=1 Tax=Natranaerobius trueperi TaxID=759412 RepID=A0A226C0S2_9FIRM|nr:acyl-CoA dehydratase activase-related protein [Natranaerobius trueperi]OWZ83977.1 hypothetical protein CDO51_05295 [Natranaerobius trueperi]
MKIGIPRGLLYYNDFPFWKTFFENLGHQVVLSQKTNRDTLTQGVNFAVDDVCLPVKVYFGHVLQLLKDSSIDKVFIPNVISNKKAKYYCPKLFAISDIISNMSDMANNKLLEIEVNAQKSRRHFFSQLLKLSNECGTRSYITTLLAHQKAKKEQNLYIKKLKQGYLPTELLENNTDLNDNTEILKIGVFGHTYNVNDEFINMGILNKLRELKAKPVTAEMYTDSELEYGLNRLYKPTFWSFGEEILGASLRQIDKREVDGVILPVAFGCGPDSLIIEICEREFSENNIPLLILTLDEHTGKAGLNTRVEAFIDMLNRRREAI